MSRNCSTWCRSLLLSFSTCYLGTLGLEGAISCLLARTSHQRTTSEKRTKVLLPKCPLFGGSTVDPTDMYLVIDVANIELHDVFHKYCISSELFTVVRSRHIVELAI